MTPSRLVLFSLLVLGSARLTAQPGVALVNSRFAQIEKLVQGEMARLGVPGVTVAIATGRDVRWAKGFGMADLENDVPATPHTVYRLGSIAKTITAVAVMQLAEHNKLDLDAPIQKYAPAFPIKPRPVTARQLLGHLSGIRHYQGDEIASTRYYPNLVEALSIFSADPLAAEPGSRYLYTTYGYVLLGVAIEGASGISYMDYVKRHILDRAAMEHTQADSVYRLIPHRTRGYLKTAAGEIMNCGLADTSNKIPAGGFSSAAGDLTLFASALLDNKLLKRASLDQMWTDQRTSAGRGTGYGLGFMLGEVDGLQRVAHTGHQQGTSTVLSILPSPKISVAILSNLEDVNWLPLASGIQHLLLTDEEPRHTAPLAQ